MTITCWIPDLECFDDYRTDDFQESWNIYQDTIYSIFKNDFIDSHPEFMEKRVNIKKYPVQYGKEDAFFHVTCKDYRGEGDRDPDMARCERIRWIRAFIENYNCDPSQCDECEGIKVWIEPYKSRQRAHILSEEERYLVIIELRESYNLLITAYYLDYDNALEKQLKKYERYKSV